MKVIIYLAVLFFISNTIFAQKFTLANEKENIFYSGIENPLSVSVEGYSCDSVFLKSLTGLLKGKSCKYNYYSSKPGVAIISILVNKKGRLKKIGEQKFKTLRIPDPIALVGTSSGGAIQRIVLCNQEFIRAELLDFDIDIKFLINSFEVVIIKDGKIILNKNYKGSEIVKEIKDSICSLHGDDMVIFKNINTVSPSGTLLNLKPIIYIIQ